MAKPVRFRDKWRIRWFDETGKRQSELFDNFDDARFALRRKQTETEEIKRGFRHAPPPDKTFDELADYYLATHTIQKRRPRDDESLIRVHLRPFFGKMKLSQVELYAEEYKASKQNLQKKTLHHQLTLLITMLRVAHRKRWLFEAPNIKKPRLRLMDSDFDYLRSKEEIVRFLTAAKRHGDNVFALYATAVYTGMRVGELSGLRWDHVDFTKRLITVQFSYDGPTESEDVRYIPILDPLLPILREWRLKNPCKTVFPSRAGTMYRDSARIFQETLHSVLDDAGFPKIERNGKIQRYITFHDLKHTFASHWMMNGGDIFRLQKIIAHKTPQMTMRYSHLAPDVFASDYGRLGTGSPISEGEVIPLIKPASAE